MKITPISFDSFGVRSMATLVEIENKKIFIDPGAALGPNRYGLSPHPIEEYALKLALNKIKSIKADYYIITHYHYDHFMPFYKYNGILLVKDPKNNINKSQFNRAKEFLKNQENWEAADGKSFDFIEFSPPVWHGKPQSKLGYVIMVNIGDFIFGSDSQGPIDEKAKDWIIEKNPKILIISGPLTYMLGYRLSKSDFEKAKENMKQIIEKTNLKYLIWEHHLVRDLNYKEKISDVVEFANKMGCEVLTAAEYVGKENLFLEAWRKKLWEENFVSKEDVEQYY